MTMHLAKAVARCPRCGIDAFRTFIATPNRGELRVSSSFSCPSCSFAEEAHGSELSNEARSAFYSTEGKWLLQINDLGPRRLDAMRVLRTTFDGTPAELTAIISRGQPLIVGTLIEIECLEEPLTEIGVSLFKSRMKVDEC
jgi:hypothetical protein